MIHAGSHVAPGPEASGRLEDPQDVQFAVRALLDCLSRDEEGCAADRASVLSALPPAPTVLEVVDAVLARRRRDGLAADHGARRRARWLLAAYFSLDPPLPAEGAGLA